MLSQAGLGSVHLSDCIKLRSPVADDGTMPPNLEWHVALLLREIELINPPAVIISGKKALRFCRKHLRGLDVPVIPVGHYANRFVSDDDVLVNFLEGIVGALSLLVAKQAAESAAASQALPLRRTCT